MCALWWPRANVFEVNGVPFRIWVAQHPDFLIQDPLAIIGTNAIPHFIGILHEPAESPKVFQVKAGIWKQLPQRLQVRFYRWYPVPRWQLKRTALFGLRFLGTEAKVALPEVLRVGLAETNRMVIATALTAALNIAPESPETFAFWRVEWERTNHYSRHDLALYLHSARYPITAAAPFLLKEAEQEVEPVTVLEAFEFLGDAARPAVPHIIRELEHQTFSGNMLVLLERLGPVSSEGMATLVGRLKDENPGTVAIALRALKSIGPEARSALSAIQPLSAHSDPTIRMLAASASAHIQGNLEAAIPVLLDGLEGRLSGARKSDMRVEIRQEMPGLVTGGTEAAAILLGELGASARAALPALETRLQDKRYGVRLSAAQAVWRITGDAKKALPALLDILDSQPQPKEGQSSAPDNYELIRAIEAIEEMGPAAKDAIPSLKRVYTFSMLARHAVNAALVRIKPTSP